MTSPYSPLVSEYPTTPDELEAFALGIPDAGQQRIVLSIAAALRKVIAAQSEATAAMATARNARQMAAANSRDPRFDTLDERIAGLATVTDELKTTQARLDDIAASYAQAVPAGAADRADLRTRLEALTPRVDQLRNDVTTNASAITAEAARATAAEQANAKATSDEVSRAKTAEAAESSLRQQGDAANAKAVTDEASARQTADTTEAKTRADADTALGVRVDTVAAGLASELTTRANADAALATRVTATEQKNATQDAALTVNTSSISALQTQVSGNTTALGTLRTDLSSLAARVAAIETEDAPPFIAGQVYGTSGGAFTYALTHGELQTIRLKVPSGSAPIKGMAFEVTNAAVTGRFVRLGLWADNGSGFPGPLLASGIVYPLSVGGKVLTFSAAINYVGQLHMGIRAEVLSGYATTIRTPDIRGVSAFIEGVPTLMSGTSAASLVSASTAVGAFANAPAVVPDIGGGPRITLVF